MNRIIITKYNNQILCALFYNQRMIEVELTSEENSTPKLDEIYVGRVDSINQNLNAAFIDIGQKENCYLSLIDNTEYVYVQKKTKNNPKLCAGDEILVQIEREAQKNKLYTVTSELTLRGHYCVISSGKPRIGISKKINGEKREFLQKAVQELNPQSYGLIIRTNAAEENTNLNDVIEEIHRLSRNFNESLHQWKHRTLYSCVRKAAPSYLDFVLNTYESTYDEIVIDDKKIFEEIQLKFNEVHPELVSKLRFYEDDYALEKLYSFEKHLQEALSERVWLKSGAYLVIQPTEALTVIDVNSGKNVQKGSKDENHRRINIEACEEIAHQLRLRNISGIIVVDFIDVANGEEELLAEMNRLLAYDPVASKVVDMTGLHLMEITRKKVKKPLSEQIRKSD